MSIRKASLQEFQHQIKDVRSQLFDQVKCLEQRTDVQCSILHEVNDFLKKRAEIDLEYSKQLDKLVKSVMLKYKNEKQKRINWSMYSSCSLWQQLVDDTKEEAKQRGITAEVYGTHVTSSIAARCSSLQKISKKCREIGVLAQGEIIRVLTELQTAMKTYQLCYSEFSVVSAKLQQAEAIKNKSQESGQSSRKLKSVQKSFNKRSEKFEAARLKCNRARNEYLLCIDAANAALHKFFADDLSDLIDCSDLGMEYWLNLILTNIIAARKAACQTEMNALANLGSFKDSIQPQQDKQKFFESNSSTFMLPKIFEFKCDANETTDQISLGEGLSEELKQRHHQIKKRLSTLRAESDASWHTLEETEQRIKDVLNASTLIDITEFGIADGRPPADSLENELGKAYDNYLQNFSFYLFNANLIMRLEARADGIGNALSKNGISFPISNNESILDHEETKEMGPEELADWHEQSRRKKRIGSQASAATNDTSQSNSSPRRRPRLFGGSLEEYTEVTGEKIPLVVISCIRVLSQFGLHHQGIFRVSGSQVEINLIKEAFERGEDPLRQVQDSSDVNSISGLLKLYLRELREPLFPFYLFELLTDCAKCASTADFIAQITPLLKKLPKATYLLLRYLFAFLNHLSEFSDENMMDPYNLAICFGPTLLPIPEGKDQVYYQNYVNEVVKNLILHSDAIFSSKTTVGPRYQKYDPISNTTDNTEIDLFVDDTDEYFGLGNGTSSATSGEAATAANGTFFSELFDYTALQKTLDELEFESPRPPVSSNGLLANYQQHPMPSLMNSSVYSNNSSNFVGRLPPSVTATLVKSGGNGVNPTYCYSSQSSENGSLSNLNGKVVVVEKNLGAAKSAGPKELAEKAPEDAIEILLAGLGKAGEVIGKNRVLLVTNTAAVSPPGASSASASGSRRSSSSAATALNVNDNNAAIAAKCDRMRIAIAPPTTRPSSVVSPPSSQTEQGSAVRPSNISVSSHPTPPSYSALYGPGLLSTPTIHLPLSNARSNGSGVAAAKPIGWMAARGGETTTELPSPVKTVNYRGGVQQQQLPDYRSPTTVKYSPIANEQVVEDPKMEPNKRSQSPVKRKQLVQLMASDSLTATTMSRK